MCFDLPGGGHALFTTRATATCRASAARGSSRARRRASGCASGSGCDGSRAAIRSTARRCEGGNRCAGGRGGSACRDGGDADAQPAVEADGHATAARGVGVLVLTADCLPVALGTDGALAMVHAGWRGLAAGVLEEGVCALRGARRRAAT